MIYKKEINNLIALASPVLLASIAQMGMGFVDTVMAGGVSSTDMAAVAVAASIWFPTILFGMGILMAMVPIIAQLNGSGKGHKVAFEVQQSIYLALALTIPTIIVLKQTRLIMDFQNVDLDLANITVGYIDAMVFAAPAFLIFQAFRSYTDGMSLTKPVMVIGFIGLALNIPLNWIFVYGKFGAPALGGVGCGVATVIVYWVMALLLVGYVLITPRLKHIALFRELFAPEIKEIWRLIKLGVPVASAIFFEVSLFTVVSLLIAPLGADTVAAHQVVLNFSSMVFMIPMSIGAAASIRVGHLLGEKSPYGATVAAKVALYTGVAISFVTAALSLIFKLQIAKIYTDDLVVIDIALSLIFFAAVYQVTDAIQVIAAGVLRGYKDMNAIFWRTLVSYWGVGLPVGYVFGLTDWLGEPMGAHGFWIGFILGLTTAAILLGQRLLWMFKQSDEAVLVFAEK